MYLVVNIRFLNTLANKYGPRYYFLPKWTVTNFRYWLKTQDSFYRQDRLLNKAKATVKVTSWVLLAHHMCPVEMKTEQLSAYSCAIIM